MTIFSNVSDPNLVRRATELRQPRSEAKLSDIDLDARLSQHGRRSHGSPTGEHWPRERITCLCPIRARCLSVVRANSRADGPRGLESRSWRTDEPCYEQITGGCVRSVRLNVTLPAGELNSAVERLLKVSVPSWKGLPQPGGGFPLPADKGCVARQNAPSILTH